MRSAALPVGDHAPRSHHHCGRTHHRGGARRRRRQGRAPGGGAGGRASAPAPAAAASPLRLPAGGPRAATLCPQAGGGGALRGGAHAPLGGGGGALPRLQAGALPRAALALRPREASSPGLRARPLAAVRAPAPRDRAAGARRRARAVRGAGAGAGAGGGGGGAAVRERARRAGLRGARDDPVDGARRPAGGRRRLPARQVREPRRGRGARRHLRQPAARHLGARRTRRAPRGVRLCRARAALRRRLLLRRGQGTAGAVRRGRRGRGRGGRAPRGRVTALAAAVPVGSYAVVVVAGRARRSPRVRVRGAAVAGRLRRPAEPQLATGDAVHSREHGAVQGGRRPLPGAGRRGRVRAGVGLRWSAGGGVPGVQPTLARAQPATHRRRIRSRHGGHGRGEGVRELRRRHHAAVAPRRHRPLPVQRVRPLHQDQRRQPPAAQGAEGQTAAGLADERQPARRRHVRQLPHLQHHAVAPQQQRRARLQRVRPLLQAAQREPAAQHEEGRHPDEEAQAQEHGRRAAPRAPLPRAALRYVLLVTRRCLAVSLPRSERLSALERGGGSLAHYRPP